VRGEEEAQAGRDGAERSVERRAGAGKRQRQVAVRSRQWRQVQRPPATPIPRRSPPPQAGVFMRSRCLCRAVRPAEREVASAAAARAAAAAACAEFVEYESASASAKKRRRRAMSAPRRQERAARARAQFAAFSPPRCRRASRPRGSAISGDARSSPAPPMPARQPPSRATLPSAAVYEAPTMPAAMECKRVAGGGRRQQYVEAVVARCEDSTITFTVAYPRGAVGGEAVACGAL